MAGIVIVTQVMSLVQLNPSMRNCQCLNHLKRQKRNELTQMSARNVTAESVAGRIEITNLAQTSHKVLEQTFTRLRS